jgi:hypothetical protein
MSNANETSERGKFAQKRRDQGTLTLGIGSVGRIDTRAGGCCAKAANAIKTTHASAMKEPGSHRFSVRSSRGISSRRAPVAVRIVGLPNIVTVRGPVFPAPVRNIAPRDACENYLERWFAVLYVGARRSTTSEVDALQTLWE